MTTIVVISFVLSKQIVESNVIIGLEEKPVPVSNGQKDSLRLKRYSSVNQIKKCCPVGSHLDYWYNCTQKENTDGETFIDKLLEIGARGNREYVITQNYEWRNCPVRQRNEFEVLHIPQDRDSQVYVFEKLEIEYDVFEHEHINFKAFKEMEYSCLELSQDSNSIVAVVCEEEEELSDLTTFLSKCCPEGELLSRNYSSCTAGGQEWVPPRKVVHHKTEKMTGQYQVKYVDQLCTDQEIQIVETVDAVTTDGHFRVKSEAELNAYHCVDTVAQPDDEEHGHDLVAVVCLQRGCTSLPCVSKCCPEKEFLSEDDGECVPANDPHDLWTHHHKLYSQDLQLITQRDMQGTVVEYSNHFIKNYLRHQSFVSNCSEVIIIDRSDEDPFFIIENGSLFHENEGITDNYCVDNTKDNLGNIVEIVLKCVGSSDKDMNSQEISDSSRCIDHYQNSLRILNTASCIISCVFLIITFLVYISVPELNNLHGKIILSNIFSIFLLTIYLLTVYHGSYYLQGLLCNLAGYTGYFLTISMFMWMTVMSFDLYWTFRRAKVPRKGSALVKFVIYSVIAWGSSTALTSSLILADILMEEVGTSEELFFYKPNVGIQKCFLHERSQGLYLHLPIMLLMIINGVFFILTIINLHRYNIIANNTIINITCRHNLTTQTARDSTRVRSRAQLMVTTRFHTRVTQDTKEQLVI